MTDDIKRSSVPPLTRQRVQNSRVGTGCPNPVSEQHTGPGDGQITSLLSVSLVGVRRAVFTRVKRHVLLALVLSFGMGPLQCATLERLSLDDMISKSTAIVRGKVTNAYAAFSGPIVYTHYTIQVTERFKGAGGNSVEVVVPGGVANGLRQSFAGTPALNVGDDFVFFLWTGKSGLTQVIGLTQGLFSVAADGTTDPYATRQATHELMLDTGTGRPVKDQTLRMHLSELRSRISSTLATANQVVAK